MSETKIGLSEFEQLKEETIKAGEIPEKYYCDECGLVKVTIEQSFELEDIFYNMSSSPPSGPILVDVCTCNHIKLQGDNEETN